MDGRGHRREGKRTIVITTMILVGLYSALMFYGFVFPSHLLPHVITFGLFFYFGLWLGLHITPDYDLAESQIYPLNRIQKKYGFLGFLWRVYWYPYGILFPHRGASHARGWGTFWRFVWAFWWAFAGTYILIELKWIEDAVWPSICLLAIFLGMWLQDDNHLYHDGLL